MSFIKSGSEQGSGATANAAQKDTAGKAIDKAVEEIKLLYTPAVQDKFHPGIEDSDDWWKEPFIEVKFTIEKAEDVPAPGAIAKKAKAGWKVESGPVKRRNNRLPQNKTGTFGPGTLPVPDLCTNLFEDHGTFKSKFDKPFSKSLSLNQAIDTVKARIKDHSCPATCGDERATLYVQLVDIGSAGDTFQYTVNWWLKIYCFEETVEKR